MILIIFELETSIKIIGKLFFNTPSCDENKSAMFHLIIPSKFFVVIIKWKFECMWRKIIGCLAYKNIKKNNITGLRTQRSSPEFGFQIPVTH